MTFKYRIAVIAMILVAAFCVNASAYEWTSYTSEENEPRTCDFDKFQSGFGCSGSYCDNVRMECHDPGISNITDRLWMARISEENGGIRLCSWGRFVTGVSTSGKYSDNISLECSSAAGVTWNGCYWTGWKSEESGGILYFPGGYYGVGVQCSGSYCDNKRFYICRTN